MFFEHSFLADTGSDAPATNQIAGVRPARYISFNGVKGRPRDDVVIEEGVACLYINGQPWVSLMCTPHDVDELALGFLRSEGIIAGLDDVLDVTWAPNKRCLDIWLRDPNVELPSRLTITTGCGGGVTFADLTQRRRPLDSTIVLAPDQVGALMEALRRSARLYQQARGVHTSALSDGRGLLLVAEDVGRHNTIDRLWGKAMKAGVSTEGRVLLTTGRISSEMLRKAAGMKTPVVITRTSPTSLSVKLATAWRITLIGYARRDGFRVYSAPQRIANAISTLDAPAGARRPLLAGAVGV